MRRFVCALLALITALCASACAAKSGGGDGLPVVMSSPEYILYQNIFYNDTGADYLGQEMTKTGTFATLYDRYGDRTRYYVWGYYDNTKCCDWQWEFVPKEGQSLPANGSLVEMKGVFSQNDDALDGYWFTDATLTTKTAYKGPGCDVDMTCMSATLERVQLMNMWAYPETFAGQTVYVYGRAEAPGYLQHPYYDGAWTQPFEADSDSVKATGTMLIVSGTYGDDGVIQNAKVTETSAY